MTYLYTVVGKIISLFCMASYMTAYTRKISGASHDYREKNRIKLNQFSERNLINCRNVVLVLYCRAIIIA